MTIFRSRPRRVPLLALLVALVASFVVTTSGSATASPTGSDGTPGGGTSDTGSAGSAGSAGDSFTPQAQQPRADGAPRPSSVGPDDAKARQLCATPTTTGKMQCLSLARVDTSSYKGVQPQVVPDGYGPGDLQDAYKLPSDGGGEGITVAITVAFDSPNAEEDLAVYREQYGLPPCTTDNGCFKKIDQRGGTDYPQPDPGWAGESALDLDMVSAACPSCKLILVVADDNSMENLGAAVNQAVEQGADFVSNSWGAPGETEDQLEWDEQYFNHPGVGITVSSGDAGYGMNYPAASKYVTSVGGTALERDDADPRGWQESVWFNEYGGPGSGCSEFEEKPDFQTDEGCDMRTVSDVSAVSDPLTGVAVYNSYQAPGWQVYGGTSAAAPLIAGASALGGAPESGSYPNSYPYVFPSGLFDVTEGNNGSCDPEYLCTAQPGYDGPTGLGTPNGILALSPPGPHGVIKGTVTDKATGDPVEDATVSAGDVSTSTDADGSYEMTVPAGTFSLTVSAFGYFNGKAGGVQVDDGATVTKNVALKAKPQVTLSGSIADGSGHGWPLYSRIQVKDAPLDAVYTDPYTGRYSISVPANAAYTLQLTSEYDAYRSVERTVKVGNADLRKDLRVPVDTVACAAPGYEAVYDGISESFDTTSKPEGWKVTNRTEGGGWRFNDPAQRGNLTGGDGNFAIVDSDYEGPGKKQNTYLTTPVVDLSGVQDPEIGLGSNYETYLGSAAQIQLSLNNGKSWKNVWQADTESQSGPVTVPIADAAGKSAVKVRFHYTGEYAYWWQIDDVYVGTRTCEPKPGGLVAGEVTDNNTGDAVNGAEVVASDGPAASGISEGTPNDPNLGDGFYWLYSSATGDRSFTASQGDYKPASESVNVLTDWTSRADFVLEAGQVVVDPGSVKVRHRMGETTEVDLKVTNDGTVPASVELGEQSGDFSILSPSGKTAADGVPVHRVDAQVSFARSSGVTSKARPQRDATPYDEPWMDIADYPTNIMDNAVVRGDDGTLYSVGGTPDGGGPVSDAYRYDPAGQAWEEIAPLPVAVQQPSAAFVDGKLVVAGGWGADNPVTDVQIYDPSSDSWTAGAAMPAERSAAGTAVLDGQMYVVGGCTTGQCTPSATEVFVYDVAGDAWETLGDYPEAVAFAACGGIDSAVICAGGVDATSGAATTSTYVLDPGSGEWTEGAELPIDMWGSAYAAANGQLLVSGGVVENGATVTNEGYAYDPAADSWSDLPASNNSVYRVGGACGFYKIGGDTGGFAPAPYSEVLPGYEECSSLTDVPWLSESPKTFSLAPGASKVVTVTLDGASAAVAQPGVYTASLVWQSDTPYSGLKTPVTMRVTPPTTWGKVTGTVLGDPCEGDPAPIAGATVQIDTWASSFTLKTDENGEYALWLDRRHSPITMIVAKDDWQPQTRRVDITAGETLTEDFTLKPADAC